IRVRVGEAVGGIHTVLNSLVSQNLAVVGVERSIVSEIANASVAVELRLIEFESGRIVEPAERRRSSGANPHQHVEILRRAAEYETAIRSRIKKLLALDQPRVVGEIGRASWRERVEI